MLEVITSCPHCKKETLVTAPVDETGKYERFENECIRCEGRIQFNVFTSIWPMDKQGGVRIGQKNEKT